MLYIVLASEREVLPRSNCWCEELQSTCDREHSRVLELEAEIVGKQQMLAKSKNQNSLIQKQFVDLQVKFQNYKECLHNQKVCEQPNATASNAIFEINKLKAQLQEKDDTIRHLHAEKDILCLLNLKEGLTSFKIQNDGYKVTNVNLNKCYQELSKSNTHLRTTSLKKIATQKAEIATLKAEAVGKKNSGPTGTPTKPKAKRVVNTSTNAWNATKNTFARIVPIWKPTGRRFNLHDIFGSRTSMEPIVKPSELTPCVSPSTNAKLSLEPILEPVELSPSVSSCASSTITMVSWFSDYRLSDRKAGSNGISSIFY
nr:hypothetical protein [Tanacetum cinerariifolium]